MKDGDRILSETAKISSFADVEQAARIELEQIRKITEQIQSGHLVIAYLRLIADGAQDQSFAVKIDKKSQKM
jgi:hypothetical protein